MSRPTALDRQQLLGALATVADAPWRRRLLGLRNPDALATLHIAVMREPFLEHVLTGRKTIESRFSINRICPFEAAEAGDIVAFKAQSGPIVGLAVVEHAAFYELDPVIWRALRRDFAGPLCAVDDEFWDQRARARYASLLRVSDPQRIFPVAVDKSDRRGWVRFPGTGRQQALAI